MSWWWAVQGCHDYLPGPSAPLGDSLTDDRQSTDSWAEWIAGFVSLGAHVLLMTRSPHDPHYHPSPQPPTLPLPTSVSQPRCVIHFSDTWRDQVIISATCYQHTVQADDTPTPTMQWRARVFESGPSRSRPFRKSLVNHQTYSGARRHKGQTAWGGIKGG